MLLISMALLSNTAQSSLSCIQFNDFVFDVVLTLQCENTKDLQQVEIAAHVPDNHLMDSKTWLNTSWIAPHG